MVVRRRLNVGVIVTLAIWLAVVGALGVLLYLDRDRNPVLVPEEVPEK